MLKELAQKLIVVYSFSGINMKGSFLWVLAVVACAAISHAKMADGRQIVRLDGDWEIAEGGMDKIAERFDRRVPVPGLVDLAKPPFAGVGETNQSREAFWYRRNFKVDGPIPARAVLKIHKAAYGCKVFLNGKMLGEHLPSFTPGYFDAREALRGDDAPNELVVRVGASRQAVPLSIPSGWDFEKTRYIPGIFDSVELILSGTPHLIRLQTAPDITNRLVRVQAVIRNDGNAITRKIDCIVREASGRIVSRSASSPLTFAANSETTAEFNAPVPNAKLWSPEHPFLYEVEVETGSDSAKARFGMREFHFDPSTGRAVLNGRPYFIRGSNVTLYRFFEDAARGDKPWRSEWVRRLHRQFREMNWHALRYCIGFPPDFWYDIADEQGFLIQDEFPLWHLDKWPAELKSDELAREYQEWMQERWNHPCVVIWDAQNETRTTETGKAIQQVRQLDLSHRPWDNGWAPPQDPGDSFESHPYLFSNPNFKLADLAHTSGTPKGNVVPNSLTNAIILNEYGWLWLNRDGTPTTLTRQVYKNLLGEDAAPYQRRYYYARTLAALTEFWRGHRACAGVLHFCGLGYSRPNGQTSDHFTNLEALTFDPDFHKYVRDAFAPVGVMIDFWAETNPPGVVTVPVVIINDQYEDWVGEVRFRLLRGTEKKDLYSETSVRLRLPALGRKMVSFDCSIPPEPGHYQYEATLLKRVAPLATSLRDFDVQNPPK